jgi:tetratricopeptide (TPR) repeat protein
LKLAEYAAARGHASEAADAYRRVIALEPRNAVAHSELGHILGAAGLWADGLREYDQAIKIDGSVQRHTETYAECLVHAHRYEEAWRELTDAFNSTPQLDRGYELLTEAGINLHKFDETEMWLLRRIDMDKEYPVNQFQACLGRLELAKPRTPSSLNAAAQWARAATEKRRGTWEQHPVKADYFALYARVQLADNQVASARASLLRGLKLEPTNVECLKEMVQLAERTKDSATAKWRAAYAKASGEDGQVVALRRDHALRPSDAAASTALAAALEKSGRSGEAADLCLDVLSAAPQNGAANAILDQCRADGLRRLDAEGARRYAAMGSP